MLVRTTINRAVSVLDASRPTIMSLVEHDALDGDLDLPRLERWVEYDPAWTGLDIWRRFSARGFAFEDEADLLPVLKVRGLLRVHGEPWCDGFLRALIAVRGGAELPFTEARRLLRGRLEVQQAAVARYAELNDGAVASLGRLEPVELEDLMEASPEPLRLLAGTCLDPQRGALFECPRDDWIARVGAMERGGPRWSATLAMLAHPTHGGLQGRVLRMLGMVERLAGLTRGAAMSDREATLPALKAMAEGEGGLAMLKSYAELRELIAAWLEWQKPDPDTVEGAFLHALLPLELPEALRRFEWDERERVTVEGLRARAITAGEVARRASARLVCVEARLRQWDRLCRVIDDAIKRINDDLDAGRPVRFPVRVSDTYKVVRPDGSIAPGLRQTVSLDIEPEDRLWLETAKASGWERSVARYLGSAAAAQSPVALRSAERGGPDAAPGDGRFYVAGGERRFHAVYAGTAPAAEDSDECHAPFLVGLYAASALVPSAHMSGDQARARNALVDEPGLWGTPTVVRGLTWWTDRTVLAHLALRHTGRVLLPYRQLRLTLAYGCAVARLELMSGMRLGETMQARHGACFREVPLGGRMVPTMRGRPKGWYRDRLWIVDRHTMALLKRIKGWVIENWHAGIGVLPIVEYGERKKNEERVQCPPARYLFLVGGRAARNEHLNMCLRIVTLGMPHARSHDYRYAFGKLLKLREATRRQRARALSHDERSAMVDQYGDWDCEGLEDNDMVVAEHQDALARELLEDLLLAA